MNEEPDYRTFSEIHRAKLITGCAWMIFVFIAFGLCIYAYGYMQPSLMRVFIAAAGFCVSLYCSWEIYLLNYIEDAQLFEKMKADPSLYPRRRTRDERTAKKFIKWLWDWGFYADTLSILLIVEVLCLYFTIQEIFS